jgi:predicted ferric reductase
MGQLALYLMALVALSVYVRQKIGQKTWRAIHYLSFLIFALALAHALGSGTDSSSLWAQAFYASTSVIFVGLLGYRIRLARQVK